MRCLYLTSRISVGDRLMRSGSRWRASQELGPRGSADARTHDLPSLGCVLGWRRTARWPVPPQRRPVSSPPVHQRRSSKRLLLDRLSDRVSGSGAGRGMDRIVRATLCAPCKPCQPCNKSSWLLVGAFPCTCASQWRRGLSTFARLAACHRSSPFALIDKQFGSRLVSGAFLLVRSGGAWLA